MRGPAPVKFLRDPEGGGVPLPWISYAIRRGDRAREPKMSRMGGRLGGGTPFWGPKLPCWPAGDQVEAKNGLKMGQNRPKTGLFPAYSQSTPKIRQKALVLP